MTDKKSSASLIRKMIPWGRPPVIRHGWLDDPLRLAILKENAAYRVFWKKHGGKEAVSAYVEVYFSDGTDLQAQKVPSKIRELADALNDGLSAFGIIIKANQTGNDLLQALDPFNEESPESLPVTFWVEVPVVQVIDFERSRLVEHDFFIDKSQVDTLSPSERILVIDVSCRKKEILKEVERFLDSIKEARGIAHLLPDEEYRKNYEMWQPDVSRRREETRKHLQVWKLRRQRKSYLQIYRETGIKVDAAKKAFARAYELIEGRRYIRDSFKEGYMEILAPELKRTCATCPDNPARGGSCSEPCPDVLAFIEQDEVRLSELLTTSRK
ncbi:MAG: hypothetical protein ACYDBT_09950 [Desulfobulbaceae bacterium]